MMHFAICLPDWNSLDSVRRAHNDLEGAAVVFFALLVVFDVLAHLSSEHKKREKLLETIGLCCFAIAILSEMVAYPYGRRNDTLSEQIIGSLDAKARKADSNASTALTKSGTALSQSNEAEIKSSEAADKAGKAQRKAEGAEDSARRTGNLVAQLRADVESTELRLAADVSHHTLWPELFGSLGSMPPVDVQISWVSHADPDTIEFARKLAAVLKRFNWRVSGARPSRITVVQTGVVIRNKWLDFPVQTSPRMGLDFVGIELDPSFMTQQLQFKSKDIGQQNALRLSTLAMSLRASLQKGTEELNGTGLDDNALFIIIGNGDSQ